MSNEKPSATLLLTFKARVDGLYTKSSDGHWVLNSLTENLTILTEPYPIAKVLFIIHNEIIPNKEETVKRVCTKERCVAPDHHRLVNKNCKSEQDWGDKEFEACGKYLLFRSKECPNPNRIKTIEGNCRIWTLHLNQSGYAKAKFLSWRTSAHILSFAVKMKSVEWSGQVRHLCNNPACIEPNHLTEGSPADQARDKIANGTSSHGDNSKLTEEQVRLIKFQDDSRAQSEIAAQYDVARSTIGDIRNGLSWAWVGKTEAENNKYVESKQKRYEPIPFEQWTDEYKSECKARLKDNTSKVEANPKELGSECWLSTYHINQSGYATITALHRTYFVHVLSYMLATNKVLREGLQVRHLCIQRPTCCNPAHLLEGTVIDQAQDRRDHGTMLYGANASNAKIDEALAQEILNTKGNEMYRWQIALKYNVTEAMVRQIHTGRTWSHLKRKSEDSPTDNSSNSNKRQHTSNEVIPLSAESDTIAMESEQ